MKEFFELNHQPKFFSRENYGLYKLKIEFIGGTEAPTIQLDITNNRLKSLNGVIATLFLRRNYASIEGFKHLITWLSCLIQLSILFILTRRQARAQEGRLKFLLLEFGLFCLSSFFFTRTLMLRMIEERIATIFFVSILNIIQFLFGIFYLRILGRNERNRQNLNQLELIFIIILVIIFAVYFKNNLPIEISIFVFHCISYLCAIKINFSAAKLKFENFDFLILKPVQILTILIFIKIENSDESMFPTATPVFSFGLKFFLTLFLIYLLQVIYHPKLFLKTAYLRDTMMFQPVRIKFQDLTKIDSDEKNSCSICLEEFFDAGEGIVMTYCKHFYHEKCLARWLEIKQECPYCKEKCKLIGDEE